MTSRLVSVLTLLLILVPVSLFAQPAAVIHSIEPNVGPTSGGTTVTISGSNIGTPEGFACILPCPPRVTFDNATVDAEFDSINVLVVKTPAHAAGVVDVKVTTPDGRTVTAKSAFTYTSSQEANYERFLLPIYLDGTVPGANGSRWRTDFWLRNNSGQVLTLAPWPCPPTEVCPAVFPLTETLQPAETIHNLPPFFAPPSGNLSRVLFASRNAASDASMNLRIYDESRGSIDAGAEVPVVRERDLRTSITRLHAVPLSGAYRLNLRVYDLALGVARFRVRVFAEVPAVDDFTQPITDFELVATTNQTGEFRWQAAYADYGSLTNLLINPVPRPDLIRIEIEPLTAGSRFWAFVSVTNNETQRVTLITPQ